MSANEEYYKNVREIRRNISDLEIKFLAGTDIKKACDIMYGLHMEARCTVTTIFNDVRIEMMDLNTAEIYGRIKK